MEKEVLIQALVIYGRAIQGHGYMAGEAIILEGERTWEDFRKWAHALAVMLRTEELLLS